MSAEPTFGTKLSSPVKTQLPGKWQVTGTVADFLINVHFLFINYFYDLTSQQCTDGILPCINHLWSVYRDLPGAGDYFVQLCSSFQEPQHSIFHKTDTAVHLFLKPFIPSI